MKIPMTRFKLLALLSVFATGGGVFANSDTLTFSGTCKIRDQSFPPGHLLATFSVTAEKPGLESETVEFTAPGVDGHNEYHVRADFHRPTLGEDVVSLSLGWNARGGNSFTRVFVGLEKGKSLNLDYEYRPASRIYCSGMVE